MPKGANKKINNNDDIVVSRAEESGLAEFIRRPMPTDDEVESFEEMTEESAYPDPERDPLMIAWPLLKTGMSYDIQGDRDRAISYYKQVQAMENAAGAQFLAERYLAKPAMKKDAFLGY